ncbi:MAG: hypothetical protein KF852_19550 [Saprospiraceae bacterium]|nr:hypothetical protein [Saprospiraceae bacterium]
MKNTLILFLAGILLLATACSKDAADIGADPGRSGSITRFAVHAGYMYVLNLNEVQTYALSNPDKPQLVHRLPTDYGLETIIVYENTVYLGSTTALYILDISNPAAPQILSQTPRLEVLSGGCDPVVVKGNYAYSTIKIIENICGRTGFQSALLVYDVSDPTAPVNVGIYSLGVPNGLGYKGDYLFVCDEGTDRVEVFDISDPLSLQLTNYFISLTDPVDLIVSGDKMIVSAKTEFRFYDISDVADIRPIGQIAK